MAQKELLFILMKLVCISLFIGVTANITYADNTYNTTDNIIRDRSVNLKEEDKVFAKELGNKSRKMSLGFIKEKWNELKKMKGFQDLYGDEFNEQIGDDFTDISLRVFVSISMNKTLLKTYATDARKYGATLVFNGLPDSSWQNLTSLIEELTNNGENPIQAIIDDEAFKQFNIQTVHTFVLSKEDMFCERDDFDKRDLAFDKVIGNIGIKGALEIFVADGDLSETAKDYLDNVR